VPTVYRERGFRFFFWSNERNEPPHVLLVACRCRRTQRRRVRPRSQTLIGGGVLANFTDIKVAGRSQRTHSADVIAVEGSYSRARAILL